MNILGVIPARYKSTRFPGKPLADICGKPMLYWVYQNASKLKEFKNIFVATDDDRIEKTCNDLGLNVIMTSSSHPTGTDRLGEVAHKIKADIYINIQGDEPLLGPEIIVKAIEPFMYKKNNVAVTNLMTLIRNEQDIDSPTVPKVAVNGKREAIFLSRLAIPFYKNGRPGNHYKQVCVYGFTSHALMEFCRLERGPSEIAEDIELLRFIENRIPVQMIEIEQETVAVDTPQDLERVKKIFFEKRGESN